MKYVSNSGRYALAFNVTIKGKEKKFEFDKKRHFLDTGNIATTGITAVEDDEYEALLKNKRFKALIDSGELILTEASQIEKTEKANDELKAENARLKKALAEAEKKTAKKATKTDTEKELQAKEEEISSLKAKLEALTKTKTESEADGF